MLERSAKEILFEDNHLLVVVKPSNIPVQEDDSGDLDLQNSWKNYLKDKYQKPGNVFLGIVHRLDRPVGGVMVFAKTSKAASRLSEQIRQEQWKKIYLAVVHGNPTSGPVDIRLEHFLLKDNDANMVQVVDAQTLGAKRAILLYKKLQTEKNCSLLQVQLLTGRSHQIRVQLSTIGHPLLGDQKYGEGKMDKISGPALWSHQLTLNHPITQENITFKANPPKVFPWNLFLGIVS
ncbi:MAG: RluA family pseudouridine synthase [Pseudomonadota bacterium]